MMNRKGGLHLTTGFWIRVAASIVIAGSLPFLIVNPSNPVAQGIFAFGNFLFVIGGNVK